MIATTMLAAGVRMASEIGVPITFDGTVGANASRRTSAEVEALVGQPIGCNIDPTATDGGKFDLGEPEEGSTLCRRLTRLRRRLRIAPGRDEMSDSRHDDFSPVTISSCCRSAIGCFRPTQITGRRQTWSPACLRRHPQVGRRVPANLPIYLRIETVNTCDNNCI